MQAKGFGATIVVAFAMYLASYAVMFRWARHHGIDDLPYGRRWQIYECADALIDHGGLRFPMLAWAEVWGVRQEFEDAAVLRAGSEESLKKLLELSVE